MDNNGFINGCFFGFAKLGILLVAMFLSLNIFAAGEEGVSPLDGEGLWSFYARTGLITKELREEFMKINEGKFDKNGNLRRDVKYRIPVENDTTPPPVAKDQIPLKPQKNDIIEPLFGREYERVIRKSNELVGATFYLVSGHGGPDPGAIGKYAGHELHEDEYAYDVILRLGRQLMERGAKVHFIIQDKYDGIRDEEFLNPSNRETCGGNPIPKDQIKRLKQRCDVINDFYAKEKKGYCRSVFIHLDSREDGRDLDIFMYHFKNSVNGKRLANNILTTLSHKYKNRSMRQGGPREFKGSVTARDLYVLKESWPAAVFIELGNLQNNILSGKGGVPLSILRFIKPSNREAMARWIAEGIVKDYEQSKSK